MKKIRKFCLFRKPDGWYPQYEDDNGNRYIYHNNRYYDSAKIRFLQDNINRANARNNYNPKWKNDLPVWYIYEIGEQQNWLCAISNVELKFTRGGHEFQNKNANPRSCVIDRIDPTETYLEGNIQLLTHAINTWKSDWTNKNLARYSAKFLKIHCKNNNIDYDSNFLSQFN